ncbi:hypothetical protein GGH99_007583 [Coemansia sp. RSA 1285]|nr:hypothetical protein GGH99_007583 [Coemansia sp. RSA 1285]
MIRGGPGRLGQRASAGLLLHRHPPTGSNRSAHSWTEAHRIFARLGSDDAYRILGVQPTCTREEIKQQYYKLCRELHPDTYRYTATTAAGAEETGRNTGPGQGRRRVVHERFVAVGSAYEVLSDPELRRKYDIHRERAATGIGSGAQKRARDPWASERPHGHGGRQKSREQTANDRRLTWGVFGFLGVLMAAGMFQKSAQYEDMRLAHELEHFRSTRALESARERASERMREAPPGTALRDYEARRLRAAAAADATDAANDPVALDKTWPHGAGLGLVALLSDAQLCGADSRRRAAFDPDVVSGRDAARRALEGDRVVGKYLLLQQKQQQLTSSSVADNGFSASSQHRHGKTSAA